jgi:hypothetical protein
LGAQGFAGDITAFVEEMFQGPAHIRLIVHDENQFAWISHPATLSAYTNEQSKDYFCHSERSEESLL